MGNLNEKDRLFKAVELGNHTQIIEIIKELLNQDITKDIQTTPLCRAVWRDDKYTAEMLLLAGSDVNNGGSRGITALMWAAKRDLVEMLELLIQYKANEKQRCNLGNSALDYAILHGNYRAAFYLYTIDGQIKETSEYEDQRTNKNYRYVNYPLFISQLQAKAEIHNIEDFFQRPQKPELIDPVIDPRETWKQFFSRILEFGPPPLVERGALPFNLQPQNRFIGKFREYLNSRQSSFKTRNDWESQTKTQTKIHAQQPMEAIQLNEDAKNSGK